MRVYRYCFEMNSRRIMKDIKLYLPLFVLLLACNSNVFAITTHPLITVEDACNVAGAHLDYRWDVKTEKDTAPPFVTPVKPTDIAAWPGPGGIIDTNTKRTGREKKWYELTGRVKLVRIEPDGDLHIQLADEKADASGVNVVIRIPYGEPWCGIRREVFSWTKRKLPFKTRGVNLTLTRNPIITVTGRAFYDAVYAVHGDTTLNVRKRTKSKGHLTPPVTIWEIHPVMNLRVLRDS
jgi:hypothetical protein